MIYDKHTSMTHLLKILCEIKKSKINTSFYHTSIILNYTHIHSHLRVRIIYFFNKMYTAHSSIPPGGSCKSQLGTKTLQLPDRE